MALPGNITPITVTGLNLPMINGQAQDGYATIDPGTVITDASGQTILAGAATTQIRASVMVPVELLPTDSADLNPPPGEWAYTLTLHLGSQVITETFELPSTLGPTVDLSALVNIAAPPIASAFATANNWTAPQTFEGNPPMIVPGGAGGDVLTLDSSGHVTPQPGGSSAVSSVNSKTGAVVLTASDVGADATGTAASAASAAQSAAETYAAGVASTAQANAESASLPLSSLPLGLTQGGTGAASAGAARTALGLGTAATQPSSAFDAAGAAATAQTAAQTFATSAVATETTRAETAEAALVPLSSLPLPITSGGTGQASQQAALTALAGTQSAGKVLRSDGTSTTLAAIQASDVPTLNQNTTGTAAGLSSTLAIGSGGTGSTTRNFGGLLTPTAVQTSAYTASAGDFVPVSTASAAVTVTLPNAPADLTVIGVKLVIQTGTNAVTVACAGSDVYNKAAGATSIPLSAVNQSVLLQYKASGGIWYIVQDGRALQPSNNLSEISLASTARTNLGLGSAATLASSAVAQTANNLSDLGSASTARTNLGLTGAATAALPLTPANGGTGQTSAAAAYNTLSPMTTLGDLEYESGAGTAARLPGNTSAAKSFLTQTGTGTVSAAPAWGTIAAADLPAGTTSAPGAVQLDGTATDIVAAGTQAAGAVGKAADAGHVHPKNAPNVQFFTASGTWTKPAGAVTVFAHVLGPGGAGGSGASGTSGTVQCGGGGGAGAIPIQRQFIASDLPSTVTVTVPSAPAGGASVTGSSGNTSGNAGTTGGNSLFGTYLRGSGGTGGSGGTTTTGTGATSGFNNIVGTPLGGGASASSSGGAGVGVSLSSVGAPGGPSGGGITSGAVASNGAGGNVCPLSMDTTGGSAGVAAGASPTSGTASALINGPYGPSAGSGAASTTGAAQAGADAFANTGAGGAGGGASLNGNASGAGGKGGSGWVLVITYLT